MSVKDDETGLRVENTKGKSIIILANSNEEVFLALFINKFDHSTINVVFDSFEDAIFLHKIGLFGNRS